MSNCARCWQPSRLIVSWWCAAGPFTSIHPRNKKVIGKRLAAAALTLAYGTPTTYLPPTYESASVPPARRPAPGRLSRCIARVGFSKQAPLSLPAFPQQGRKVFVACAATAGFRAVVLRGWDNVARGVSLVDALKRAPSTAALKQCPAGLHFPP